jgi:hypothetical protein
MSFVAWIGFALCIGGLVTFPFLSARAVAAERERNCAGLRDDVTPWGEVVHLPNEAVSGSERIHSTRVSERSQPHHGAR